MALTFPATPADIIASSMRLLQALRPGETPSNSELTDFLARMNDMIDQANADRLNLLPSRASTLTAASAKASYTIGPSATDFNTARPVFIQSLSQVFNGVKLPIDIVDSTEFASVRDLAATAKLVEKAFCDFASPIATVYVWPVPAATPTFEMWSWTALATYATVLDPVDLPPAYSKWLQYDLAMNIAADLGTPGNVLQLIAPIAASSKADWRSLNEMYLTMATRGKNPNIGSPYASGATVAPPQLGGDIVMVPPGQR